MANVRLPQIDLRQPELHSTSYHPKPGIAPAIKEANFQQTNSSARRNNKYVDSDLTELNITQAVVSKDIKVKIPRFTYINLQEQRHTPSTPAGLFRPKSSKALNLVKPGKIEASARFNHSSARLLRDRGSSAKRSASLKNTSELKTTVTKLTPLEGQSRAGRGEVFTAVETRGSRGRGNINPRNTATRAISRSNMKVDEGARARYEPANENDRTHASTMRAPSTSASPQSRSPGARTTARITTLATTDSLHLSSPPRVTAHHARHNSSPRQWTDYANHLSNRGQQQSPLRSAPRRSRGGTMSHRTMLPHTGHRGTMQRQSTGPVARLFNNWTTWVEIHVILFRLSPTISTGDLWKSFHDEGNITFIEIFEDSSGSRTGKAKIKFSPPPTRAFWLQGPRCVTNAGGAYYVTMELDSQPRTFKAQSPVNPMKRYQEVMTLNPESVDFGIMYDEDTMMSMFTASASSQKAIQFRQSLLHREIVMELELAIPDPQPSGTHPKANKPNRIETFRFHIPFRQLEEVHRIQADQERVVLLMSLDQPPRVFRKVEEDQTHEDNGRYWTQNDAWYRQTDILCDPKSLRSSPLTLKKVKPLIDIGRWTTYRFSFDMKQNDRHTFHEMCQALNDYNVHIAPFPNFKLIQDREPAVWEYIDKPLSIQRVPKNALEELTEDVVQPLSFPVRFQLEVCISQGLLNEHNLTRDFVARLIAMDPIKAQDILEYVANQKKRLYEPMRIFSMTVIKGSTSTRKIPYYCAYVRSATVTPATVYYNTPTVDTSNRIIRRYAEHADRFLRVRFTDEKSQGRINSTHKDTMDEVFTRIKRTMMNGITIGDRHYEFLAFGNSQFRENGAYFFAPLPYLNARHIRQWMGDFKKIHAVAKHAARLGQCFSTTRAINCTKPTVVEIDDIWRNNYNFTDGVGKISPFLAQLVASELGLTTPEPPSVFQYRSGGFKGVLAVSYDAKQCEIHVRESQYKFDAKHELLEIIRWSQMATANLNRQLILVLSALGVADEVFLGKLKMQLASLEYAMKDEKAALALLQRDIDANQMTLTLAGMILDGFHKANEPFIMSLLHLWRAWSIKYLKEKARITISDGALLLGCIDETGKLQGHRNDMVIGNAKTLQEKVAMLPQVFVQLSKGPDNLPYIVKGPMLLARNPSLHPGDIRVVCGVDVPELHHLKDAVVLPQTGDRDISSMCSGGDLDGDDYLVTWDRDLLPSEWNHDPMDYTAPKPLEVDRDVTTDDITSFFVTYMKNDTLPKIAHAHVALADYLDDGVKDEKCLELARLHSKAVDYVKSGIPAHMTRDLYPRKWPHFMEKIHKPKEQIYESKKVLGQLYDQVERIDFIPAFDKPFDQRVLYAYQLDPNIIQAAANLKFKYDAAMRRIMAQHEIKTEFEVWSTFVLQHSNAMKDYKFHEEIGRLSHALKDEFRAECYRTAGGKDSKLIAPFVAAMYHVTNEEVQIALRECHQTVTLAGVNTPLRDLVAPAMPLMSFPWLFPNILGRIANGDISVANDDPMVYMQNDSQCSVAKHRTLETAEEPLPRNIVGVKHDEEKLILLEDPDEGDMPSSKQQAAPKESSAYCPLILGIQPSGPAEMDLLLEDETAQIERGSDVLSKKAMKSLSSSSILSTSAIEDSNACLDELFERGEKDVGTVSKILTPSNSDLGSSNEASIPPEAPMCPSESVVNTETHGSFVRDEWEKSEDGSSDGMIEVHIDRKELTYLDRLARLNES